MTQGAIRNLVAALILGGHLSIFICALLLGLVGPLKGTDLVQVVLIGSPILCVTAGAALRFVLEGHSDVWKGSSVTATFASVVILIPSALIASVLVMFYAIFKQINGFGPNELKVGLGAIETFFGIFIGMISDKLFGTTPRRPML